MEDSDKTFVKITNKDIYDKICTLEAKNDAAHLDILLHQSQTNGKVKTNKWIATTALSLIVALYCSGLFSKIFG
jgi:hypothetical protein